MFYPSRPLLRNQTRFTGLNIKPIISNTQKQHRAKDLTKELLNPKLVPRNNCDASRPSIHTNKKTRNFKAYSLSCGTIFNSIDLIFAANGIELSKFVWFFKMIVLQYHVYLEGITIITVNRSLLTSMEYDISHKT